MIHVFSSHIINVLETNKLRLFGSILYDEFGNDDIKLNFFSAYIDFTEKLEENDDVEKSSKDQQKQEEKLDH